MSAPAFRSSAISRFDGLLPAPSAVMPRAHPKTMPGAWSSYPGGIDMTSLSVF